MAARPAHDERERRNDALQSVDCIVLMDIDHFKHVNDRWGHCVGDTVLVEVARRLTAAVRDSDMVIRWGGEEFLIYAPGADPAHVAGVADGGVEWERGIRLADWALYHGKANGRNQARIVMRLSAPVDTVLAAAPVSRQKSCKNRQIEKYSTSQFATPSCRFIMLSRKQQ
ncbi:hypothetical protein CR152_19175 [Massilia violaceinigra]|uniref:diguanylate cyclase n=1 Tax=Massilia violaceinigra TaxID=2045208 RepID=A0A2D2DN74_9BURK|nr:hypothetical protein CR152_19175 [Massilia violaceinigra]